MARRKGKERSVHRGVAGPPPGTLGLTILKRSERAYRQAQKRFSEEQEIRAHIWEKRMKSDYKIAVSRALSGAGFSSRKDSPDYRTRKAVHRLFQRAAVLESKFLRMSVDRKTERDINKLLEVVEREIIRAKGEKALHIFTELLHTHLQTMNKAHLGVRDYLLEQDN